MNTLAILSLLAALLAPSTLWSGQAAIFSGSDILTLKPSIDLGRQVKIKAGSANPTSSAQNAPAGSTYHSTSTGRVYRKTDSGSSTNWAELYSPGGTDVAVADGGTGSSTLTANNVILGNGTSAVQFVAPGTSGNVLTSNGTTWSSAAASGGVPTVQKFTSGSGTYTTPANVKWIRVRLSGAGGGGGSDTGGGSNGGGTTFGTSLLSGSGGQGGFTAAQNNNGGAGGAASLGTGPLGLAIRGGDGSSGSELAGAGGANGGSNTFGGAGRGGGSQVGGTMVPGRDGATNAGAGGGGGGGSGGSSGPGGGGAGGYVDAIIVSPSSTYAYAIGAAGGGHPGGTSAGGSGSAGIVIVEEFY